MFLSISCLSMNWGIYGSSCDYELRNLCIRDVTQDETWVHHFDSEAKKQNMQWNHPGSLHPKKFKRVSSTGKVMASIFWDSQGIIMVDYLEEGCTINSAYYTELRQLHPEIMQKRRGRKVYSRCSALIMHQFTPLKLLLWLNAT